MIRFRFNNVSESVTNENPSGRAFCIAEGHFEVIRLANAQGLNRHAKHRRDFLNFLIAEGHRRVVSVPEISDSGAFWHHSLQKFKPLGAQLGRLRADACDVSSGEAVNQANTHWIASTGKDNGNGRRCELERLGSRAPSKCNDCVRFHSDRFGRKCRKSVDLSFSPSPDVGDILAIDITAVSERLSKRRRRRSVG